MGLSSENAKIEKFTDHGDLRSNRVECWSCSSVFGKPLYHRCRFSIAVSALWRLSCRELTSSLARSLFCRCSTSVQLLLSSAFRKDSCFGRPGGLQRLNPLSHQFFFPVYRFQCTWHFNAWPLFVSGTLNRSLNWTTFKEFVLLASYKTGFEAFESMSIIAHKKSLSVSIFGESLGWSVQFCSRPYIYWRILLTPIMK